VSKLNHEYVSSPITVLKPQGYPTPGIAMPSINARKSRLIIQLTQGKQKKHESMKDGGIEAAL
jgi:hypothetical protein